MLEKIETDVDRLFLALTMKKHFLIYFAKTEFFLNFETKCSLSTSVFNFVDMVLFLKVKWMAFPVFYSCLLI